MDHNSIEIIDIQNTAFKYPENEKELLIKINYFDIVYEDINIDKILEDVNELRSNLRSIKTVISNLDIN